MDTFMDQFAEKEKAQEMIRANVTAELEESSIKKLEEKMNGMNDDLRDGYHKECVKVYRNVQAAFTAENEKQTKLISEEITKIGEKMNLTFIFAVLAFATGVVSLLLQILSMLKIIP